MLQSPVRRQLAPARLVRLTRKTVFRSAQLASPLRAGPADGRSMRARATDIVEEGQAAYGKHTVKAGEADVSEELLQQFLKVQNGSDIRGVVLDGIKGEPISLTLLMVFFIGRGFATWVSRKLECPTKALRLAVGTDSRVSSLAMRCSFEAGVASKGGSIANCGMATTPAMFFSTVATGHTYDGGVMITASHLPFNRNGLKFFTKHGGLDKTEIRWILEEAATDCGRLGLTPGDDKADPGYVIDAARAVDPSSVVKCNLMEDYCTSLRQRIIADVEHPDTPEQPLNGMHVLVDAGNGAGGFFASDILAPLGASTAGSQFLDPDGTFPNHIPNPEDAEAMSATIDAVIHHKADLGVVFDTDVDRSGVVDASGRAINKNKLIALMAAITLKEQPGTTVVTDSVTSSGLTAFIEGLDGVHCRYKRGYKNVINKGVELNDGGEECELMMETSGHGAMRQNRFLDDGAFIAVKIIIEAARRRWQGRQGVSEILKDLKEPTESEEVRLKIKADNFKPVADAAIGSFQKWVEATDKWELDTPNHEGVRARYLGDDGAQTGWALMRASLHDPLVVINAESDASGGVGDIMRAIRGCLVEADTESCDADSKDCSSMNAYLEISGLNRFSES